MMNNMLKSLFSSKKRSRTEEEEEEESDDGADDLGEVVSVSEKACGLLIDKLIEFDADHYVIDTKNDQAKDLLERVPSFYDWKKEKFLYHMHRCTNFYRLIKSLQYKKTTISRSASTFSYGQSKVK